VTDRKEYMKNWRKNHPNYNKEHSPNYMKNYYQAHKKDFNIRCKKWAKENPERYREKQRKSNKKYKEKLKTEIFILLGNKCSNTNCPIPPEKMEKEALQIDHINGGGCKERKKNGRNDAGFYLYVLKEIQSGSKNYQLLCAYCNWLKQFKREKI
jgi:hypothetical protein